MRFNFLRISQCGSLLLASLLASCGGSDGGQRSAEFTFRLRNQPASESFQIRSDDPAFIDSARKQLALPVAQRTLHPAGRILRGSAGYNESWGWHLVDVRLSEVDAEVCDGLPSHVQADLRYWVDVVGTCCPWGAFVDVEKGP